MKDGQPEVSVRLKRHAGNKILVVIHGDPCDEEPAYFDNLTWEEPVGFVLDPLGDPHRVSIDKPGVYGGNFVLLNEHVGGFAARPPQALVDLLLPDGADEATYPCHVESGEWHLFFDLPNRGSLMSMFFKGAPSTRACEAPAGACPDASLSLS